MTSLYDRWILPGLLKAACSSPAMAAQRAKVVPFAEGRVLELGVAMGLNLAHYNAANVSEVIGVDPSPELRALAMAAPRPPALSVHVQDGSAEALPLDDASVDTVVCTFTLCSVCAPPAALAEARRVLRPGGRLLFCEHGLSPEPRPAAWQRRIEPVWKRLAGGCHLTRPISGLIADAGFTFDRLERRYLPKVPRFAGWCEWGAARPV